MKKENEKKVVSILTLLGQVRKGWVIEIQNTRNDLYSR